MRFINAFLPAVFVLGYSTLCMSGCTGTPLNSADEEKPLTSAVQHFGRQIDTMPGFRSGSLTDPRDGEIYSIATIGKQSWMAENLRFKAPASWINPENPSLAYGRMYNGLAAQNACPPGWHLPSDMEWNELEMTLGMAAADTINTGWRGNHGTAMKSVKGWFGEGNGTDSSGFNGLPSGYYDSGFFDGGIDATAGYWTSWDSTINGVWVRFLAAPLMGVNRFYDDNLSTDWGLACRCVKD